VALTLSSPSSSSTASTISSAQETKPPVRMTRSRHRQPSPGKSAQQVVTPTTVDPRRPLNPTFRGSQTSSRWPTCGWSAPSRRRARRSSWCREPTSRALACRRGGQAREGSPSGASLGDGPCRGGEVSLPTRTRSGRHDRDLTGLVIINSSASLRVHRGGCSPGVTTPPPAHRRFAARRATGSAGTALWEPGGWWRAHAGSTGWPRLQDSMDHPAGPGPEQDFLADVSHAADADRGLRTFNDLLGRARTRSDARTSSSDRRPAIDRLE
jgi:hypothetical protein